MTSQCSQPSPAGARTVAGEPSCDTDAMCTNGAERSLRGQHGSSPGMPLDHTDACVHDSDCPAGEVCSTFTARALYSMGSGQHLLTRQLSRGRRLACGDGYCSPSPGGSCGLLAGYYCHTASDTCASTDSQCASELNSGGWSSARNRWECQDDLLCA